MKGGSFTGDPGGCVKEGSGHRHLSPRGPHWGTWKGVHLLGLLTENENAYLGSIFLDPEDTRS